MKDLTYFIGIDPGYKSGAICIADDQFITIDFIDIEKSPHAALSDLGKILDYLIQQELPYYIALEDVHSSPQQGVASAFIFGKALGLIEGFCKPYTDSLYLVPPKTWQSLLDLPAPQIQTFTQEELENVDTLAKRSRERKSQIKSCVFNQLKRQFPCADLQKKSRDQNRADALGITLWMKTYHHESIKKQKSNEPN